MVKHVPVVMMQSVTISLELAHVNQATWEMIVDKVCYIHLSCNGSVNILECANGTYGEGCSRQCSCDEEGTASSTCHHINGPTCVCYPEYTGLLCQTSESCIIEHM